MDEYDADRAPDPEAWLAMDEDERMFLVQEYHEGLRFDAPSMMGHAIAHIVVENQLASGEEDVVRALERLTKGGLDRHEAVHAIGAMFMEHAHELIHEGPGDVEPNEAYFAKLRELTVDRWRTR
ncbi:MAG: hypothetical protein JSV80_01770 [Acidobacteriota bacterium]|nr:MAG: hypothetical protein JSV80_01770 [Acidobacteriota bacterium]